MGKIVTALISLISYVLIFANIPLALDSDVGFELSFSLLGAYKRTMQFNKRIIELSGKYKVNPDLVTAIIMYESAGHESFKSSAGAQGIMQVMPETMRSMNSSDSLDAGIKYLAYLEKNLKEHLNKQIGREPAESLLNSYIVMAYNAGPGFVKKGRIKLETMQYLQGVSLYYNLLKQERETIAALAEDLKITVIKAKTTWKELSEGLGISVLELRMYNPIVAHRKPDTLDQGIEIVYPEKEELDLIGIQDDAGTERIFYKTRQGDIFHYISNAFGFEYDDLRTKNSLLLWGQVPAGIKLEVTGSRYLKYLK